MSCHITQKCPKSSLLMRLANSWFPRNWKSLLITCMKCKKTHYSGNGPFVMSQRAANRRSNWPARLVSSLPTKSYNRAVVVVIFAAGCKNGWRDRDHATLLPIGGRWLWTDTFFAGEGSEEIGNLIENYIKEIEELRCFFFPFPFELKLPAAFVKGQSI